MYESLHNHTTMSDGVLPALELLKVAEKNRIGVMALTDHDVVPKRAELEILRHYSGGVKWLVGVELSSWVPKSIGDSDKGAVHILGLFVDPTYGPLVEFCENAEVSRTMRMRTYVKHLNGIGLQVTEADVQRAATSNNIGKPHIVKAVLGNSQNMKVLDKMRESMRKDSEHDARLKISYDRMIAEGPRQYPYTLFMGSEAYYPAPKTDFGGLLDFDATVKLIRDAGGIAILAHWYLDKSKIPSAALETIIVGNGLDGLETEIINTMSDHASYGEDVTYLRELVRRHNLVEEVSSDGHSATDLAAFANDPIATYSIGQTARMIKLVQPNLKWSNL
jgi:predicted metal-dependent phosphoesterase TrpH